MYRCAWSVSHGLKINGKGDPLCDIYIIYSWTWSPLRPWSLPTLMSTSSSSSLSLFCWRDGAIIIIFLFFLLRKNLRYSASVLARRLSDLVFGLNELKNKQQAHTVGRYQYVKTWRIKKWYDELVYVSFPRL